MIAGDQTPAERRTILDFAARLGAEGHTAVLAAALAEWAARDDTRADPGARHAANTAMTEIDEMLRELYTLRGRLVGEIRLSDGAAMVRSEALLAKARALSAEPEL
jgi:hypothetical protein